MMPAKAVGLIKFAGRSDLKDLVPVCDQLVEWGGEKSYHFVFEPEFLPAAGPTTINGQYDDARKKVSLTWACVHLEFAHVSLFAQVHFAEGTTSNDSSPVESTESIKKLFPGNQC